jgi:hypothetical protein
METHDDPARPEQTDESYATGADHKPDSPEEELEPDFARGLAETEPRKRGRFSTGEEQLADSPDKEREGSFGDTDEHDSSNE